MKAKEPMSLRERVRWLVLWVRDHGIGIEPAYLALIFRRFYRVGASLTREANGLGLALYKAMVICHRGLLWIKSAVEEGSAFAIVLSCGNVPETNLRVEA